MQAYLYIIAYNKFFSQKSRFILSFGCCITIGANIWMGIVWEIKVDVTEDGAFNEAFYGTVCDGSLDSV